MKKNLKSIEGNYYSTYAFVSQNNLEAIANKVLGKGWEAEDDVNQIQEIINAMVSETGTFAPIAQGMHIHPALPEVVQNAFGNLHSHEH